MTGRRLAILGSTASGKSSLAMALAESASGRSLDLEIVSIDAMQVYRDMNIGTAKPGADEQSRVRHHLIDLVDAQSTFTVAQFQHAYTAVIADISSRGARPLLVGGTGLYLRAVVDTLTLPGQWPDVRARLEQEVLTHGAERLYQRLVTLDPSAAAKMEPTNARRIVRALEVTEGSGHVFSSFGPGVDTYPPSDVHQIALRWNRQVLGQRIEARVLAMMDAGLLAEVQRNYQRGLSVTARQALGYKELIEHIEGHCTLDEAIQNTIVHTRQFAVRQERWFRRDPRIQWFDVEHDPVSEVTVHLATLVA